MKFQKSRSTSQIVVRDLTVIITFVLTIATCGLESPIVAQVSLPASTLNTVHRVQPGVGYMSSSAKPEWSMYPDNGPIWYFFQAQQPGTTPVYRFHSNNNGDHQDLLTSSAPAGYTFDGPLGYVYSSSQAIPNPSQLTVLTDSSDTYHATVRPDEVGNLSGYSNPVGLPGWTFGLFNTTPHTQPLNPLTLSAGGVTLQSNIYAGGSIFTWTWNGTQFVNNDYADLGREIQATIFTYTNQSTVQNPTEAGDTYDNFAPIQTYYNVGNTQVTNSIPLEFEPENFGGGIENPVAYPGTMIGKQITLNYANLGPVAEYITTYNLPSPLGNNPVTPPSVEIPSVYLNSSTFNRFYTYDAKQQLLAEVTGAVDQKGCNLFPASPGSGYGGVIISDSTGANAMASYGALTSVGGYVSDYAFFDCSGGGTNKFRPGFDGNLPQGPFSFVTYLMTGSVSQVKTYMNSLYAMKSGLVGSGPTGWAYCGVEGEICSVTGPGLLAYGTNFTLGGQFNYQQLNATSRYVTCNNATFGDPDVGAVKSCYFIQAPAGYTYCSVQNSTCNLSGSHHVAYGANGQFSYATESSSFACNDTTFSDPNPAIAKACFYQ